MTFTAGISLGEWLGWPFLAAPLRQAASKTLDRQVTLTAPFQIRFLGGLRLSVSQLGIAAPSWSTAPHLLEADELAIVLRYTDLWHAYQGQPLRIQGLQARALDTTLERQADGRASWQFGAKRIPPSTRVTPIPQFGNLLVTNGVVRYKDAPLAVDIEAHLTLTDQPSPVLKVDAAGNYRKLPVKISLAASGALPWATENISDSTLSSTHPLAVPLTLTATVGRASLDFKGSVIDVLHMYGLTGRFSLKGPSLAAVGDPVGVTLPTTAAFRTDGLIVKQGEAWRVVIDDATVGASRLNGAFSYETLTRAGRSVPVLAGRLGGKRLLLADLGPVVGTTPKQVTATTEINAITKVTATTTATKTSRKVLPDRPFDLAALRAMDANVLIDIAEVDLNTPTLEPLRPLRGHLQLESGVLTLKDLEARTAQGRLRGDLSLDGRETTAVWKANLRWSDVLLERWIHQNRAIGSPPFISGRLYGKASLEGQGRSTAEILASLKGTVRTDLRGGTVSHLIVEVAGLDIAQGLGMLIKGDDALPVQCAVADLAVNGGVLRPRVMVMDTTDSAIWIDGSHSLATEALDLRAVVSPKDFSPMALRSPLHVQGTFAKPEVSVEKGPVGRKLGAALLLALVNPLAALIPFIDTGDSDAAARSGSDCTHLKQRSAGKGVNRLTY